MAEYPILFNSYAVRAILDGTKTQTRRVILKKRRIPEASRHYGPESRIGELVDLSDCPYGVPGDHLWVREAFAEECFTYGMENTPAERTIYRADYPNPGKGWCPSIHMPKWASRIMLEVIDIRTEQLKDINLADAVAEGFPSIESNDPMPPIDRIVEPFEWFHQLWDSIYAKRGYGWNTNPWVWVVEFRRI